LAKICFSCGKGTVAGNAVSHSHVKVKRTWEPNLHRVRIVVEGAPRRAYVCSKCLKSGKVERAV